MTATGSDATVAADEDGIDRSPSRTGLLLAALAALASVVALALAGGSGGPLGGLGAGMLVLGAAVGRRGVVDVGLAVLVAGAVLSGLAGVSAEPLLVAAVAAVVARDAAGQAIGLGEQLGTAAPTARVEAVHAGATLLVGVVAASGAAAVFRLAGGGRPVGTLALLLVGAVLLTAALRS